jgi:hypothetical protein
MYQKNMNDVLTKSEFHDLWLNKLTAKQRKTRSEIAFNIIKKVADKQLNLFKHFEKRVHPDNLRFHYFYITLKNIWENIEFILSLGRGKNRNYAFYPARTIVENTFRLDYFTRQKNERQEEIALKEVARISKRLYDMEFNDGNLEPAEKFKGYYDTSAKWGSLPNIDDVTERELEPFPSIKDLMKDSKIEGGIKWYPIYQALAEMSHGKLMHIIMLKQSNELEYNRSLMCTIPMGNQALKIADFHLSGKTRAEVIKALQDAQAVVRKPI